MAPSTVWLDLFKVEGGEKLPDLPIKSVLRIPSCSIWFKPSFRTFLSIKRNRSRVTKFHLREPEVELLLQNTAMPILWLLLTKAKRRPFHSPSETIDDPLPGETVTRVMRFVWWTRIHRKSSSTPRKGTFWSSPGRERVLSLLHSESALHTSTRAPFLLIWVPSCLSGHTSRSAREMTRAITMHHHLGWQSMGSKGKTVCLSLTMKS